LLYLFDDFVLDLDRRELRRDNTSIAVEPQVFDLLEYLIRHRERVVSRDELIGSIWGRRIVSESALNTRLSAVRSAIGDSGTEQRLIRTLPRKGVRFVGEVREEQDAASELTSGPDSGALQVIDAADANGGMPVGQAVDGHSEIAHLPKLVPIEVRRFAHPRAAGVLLAAGLLCFAALTWSFVTRSAQAERSRANAETAARLADLAGQINMTSRGNYDAVRGLGQWSVDLDPPGRV
jgi:DNA-binding winged helix-turn-helix (wHTH) protein